MFRSGQVLQMFIHTEIKIFQAFIAVCANDRTQDAATKPFYLLLLIKVSLGNWIFTCISLCLSHATLYTHSWQWYQLEPVCSYTLSTLIWTLWCSKYIFSSVGEAVIIQTNLTHMSLWIIYEPIMINTTEINMKIA